MTDQKLKEIISRKNEDLEQNAVRRARELIDAIGECQQDIAQSQNRITELRAELKKLEIQQINPESILGS